MAEPTSAEITHHATEPQGEKKEGPFYKRLRFPDYFSREDQFEGLIKKLKELGAYKEGFLYRGFDGNRIKYVRKFGTDTPKSPTIFAYTEKETRLLLKYPTSEVGDPLSYAHDHDKPAISIYKPEYFSYQNVEEEFMFKKDLPRLEGLVGVFLLEVK